MADQLLVQGHRQHQYKKLLLHLRHSHKHHLKLLQRMQDQGLVTFSLDLALDLLLLLELLLQVVQLDHNLQDLLQVLKSDQLKVHLELLLVDQHLDLLPHLAPSQPLDQALQVAHHLLLNQHQAALLQDSQLAQLLVLLHLLQ